MAKIVKKKQKPQQLVLTRMWMWIKGNTLVGVQTYNCFGSNFGGFSENWE